MTGSLLQIVSSGIKDVFLTIDPQITFFKIVYMRHTPFSIDMIEETFNYVPNFGEEGFCELTKNGDLISNIFLKIVLPDVQISNQIDSEFLTDNSEILFNFNNNSLNANQHIINFNTIIDEFKLFVSSSMVYWNQIKTSINNLSSNYNTINNLINVALNSQNDIQNNYDMYNTFVNVHINNNYQIFFNFDILNYIKNNFTSYNTSIYNSKLTLEYKDQINSYLSNYILYQKIYLKYIIDTRDKVINIQNNETSSIYNFAWVNKIGFALINYITIEIGGQVIDKVNSTILNNNYELLTTIEKRSLLDKMIGNIDVLTSYNSVLTPTYTLLIPLPFWFCKYKSQALACVGLKYNDIIIKVKLNELYNCCYFEPNNPNVYTTNLNINELIQLQDISLLVEYIHLGEDERKKFGSFTNESLIEQHRLIEFTNIVDQTVFLPLDFVNPVRELIWTVQKTSNINNLLLWNNYENMDIYQGFANTVGETGIYTGMILVNLIVTDVFSNLLDNFNNFTDGYIEIFQSKYYNGIYKILFMAEDAIVINNKNYIYPDYFKIKLYLSDMTTREIINNENIQIYGSNVITLRDSLYFTTVQNYQHHSYIPKNIHTYSFCLNTEDYQPSGSLNFSVIDSKNLYLEFNNEMITNIDINNDSYNIKIYAKSHNILKIENGIGKIQFGI